jgi:glutaredoxin-like protein
MAQIMDEKILTQVGEVLKDIQHPVAVLLFTSAETCEYCAETRQLLEEIVPLSPMVKLYVHDLHEQAELAAQYHVTKSPTIVIAGLEGEQVVDHGVRFAGIPAGHEFTSLINDLVMVGRRDSGLSAATREFLAKLDQPVYLEVFVTPTCPFCPRAVILAHKMALESPWVQAEGVEATEFPELSDKYNVSSVPHTAINLGAAELIGAGNEQAMVGEIKKALKN